MAAPPGGLLHDDDHEDSGDDIKRWMKMVIGDANTEADNDYNFGE